jgi:hypothetical protein
MKLEDIHSTKIEVFIRPVKPIEYIDLSFTIKPTSIVDRIEKIKKILSEIRWLSSMCNKRYDHIYIW